jgi:hypothetical protein
VTTRDLRNPWALDASGDLVAAPAALRGVDYWCPACHAPLNVRQGEKVVRHLYHPPEGACTGETVRHAAAHPVPGGCRSARIGVRRRMDTSRPRGQR